MNWGEKKVLANISCFLVQGNSLILISQHSHNSGMEAKQKEKNQARNQRLSSTKYECI